MTYGPIVRDMFRRVTPHVGKILNCANVKAATGLELTIPPSGQRRADRVIQ